MTFASYIFGYAALTVGVASVAFAGWRLRRSLLPSYQGSLARLTEVVLALALLVVTLQVVGAVGLFSRVFVVIAVPAVALTVAAIARPHPTCVDSYRYAIAIDARPPERRWAVALVVLLVFVVGAQWVAHSNNGLNGGMRDFDTLRYHGPFAARFVQEHTILRIEHTSAENQESYFPGNTELLDAYAMTLFGRDLFTPLRNFVWLAIALLAAWAGGRRLGSAPAATAAVAAFCSTPLITAIEPGSAKNDVVAFALLIGAAAFLLYGLPGRDGAAPRPGAFVLAGFCAGLAVGSKLTVLAPLVVVFALALAAAGRSGLARRAVAFTVPALVTGGIWYARNLANTGTPLPWFRLHLGPITLAGPDMPYNDQFGFSVAHYVARGSFWSDTVFSGLAKSFGGLFAVLVLGALAVAVFAVAGRNRGGGERVIGCAALVTFVIYLFTPWGAGGPEGNPHLFATDLRFLAPFFGLAALAAARPQVARYALIGSAAIVFVDQGDGGGQWRAAIIGTIVATMLLAAAGALVYRAVAAPRSHWRSRGFAGVLALALVGGWGWRVQREYFATRYSVAPTTLTSVYEMFRDVRGVRIAVAGFADDYPLYGVALKNRVQYVGSVDANGAYGPTPNCRVWLTELRDGRYDYVVLSKSPGALSQTPTRETGWTLGDPAARLVFHHGVTTVFRVEGTIDPTTCA